MSAIVAVPYDSAVSQVSETMESSLSVTVTLGKKDEAVVKSFRIRGLDLADLQLDSLRQSIQQVLGVDYPLIIRNVAPGGEKYCLNKQSRLVRALNEAEGSLTLLCRRKYGAKSKKEDSSYVDWISIDEEELSASDSSDDSEPEETEKPRRRGRHHAHCHHYHEECRRERDAKKRAAEQAAEPEEATEPTSADEQPLKQQRRGRHHAHCYHYHEECRKQREQEEKSPESEEEKEEKRAARLQAREEKRQEREQKKALREARREEKQAEKAARKEMKQERKQEKKAARAAAKRSASSDSEESASSSSSDEGRKAPRERFAEHLKVLASMGFDKERVNLRLLKRFDGNVSKVAQELATSQLKKAEKEARKAEKKAEKQYSPRRHRRSD